MLPPDPFITACPLLLDPAIAGLGGFAVGIFACALLVLALRLREAPAPLDFADDPPSGDVPHVESWRPR